MSCRATEREALAEEYVRGQLCPREQEEFEVHLLECPKCLARVETLSEVEMGLVERDGDIRGAVVHGSKMRMWTVVIAVVMVLLVVLVEWWRG
jgi:anti-sigma factor RsiW